MKVVDKIAKTLVDRHGARALDIVMGVYAIGAGISAAIVAAVYVYMNDEIG